MAGHPITGRMLTDGRTLCSDLFTEDGWRTLLIESERELFRDAARKVLTSVARTSDLTHLVMGI